MAPQLPDFSNTKLARITTRGPRLDLWAPSSFDYDVFEDKFWGDLLRDEYPAAKTNGTSAAVTFTEHNNNGYLDLVSGTATEGYAGQGLGHQFTGDRGVLFECIIKLPAAITTMKFEVGLTDADDDAGAINLKANPTYTAADFGVFVFDTDDASSGTSATTIDFISAKTGDGVVAANLTSEVWTPSASETIRFSVRVEDDNVSAAINGKAVAGHGAGAGIQGGSSLTPWVFVQARAGSASRTVQLHKWRAIQPAY
jgi:hypothetical protein